jgi:hypothetical protein
LDVLFSIPSHVVGEEEGKLDGTNVGLIVGLSVGEEEGKLDGTNVGLTVGLFVGLIVSPAFVGENVGDLVGITVGNVVG